MRYFILVTFIGVCVGCNSGSKKDSEPTTADTTAPPPATTAPGTEVKPAGKIDIESFGDIKIGQPSAETLKALGEPEKKSKAEEWAADGLMHEYWTWKSKGLEINMSSDKNNMAGTMAVFNINAEAPSAFKTRAGIGIGSTYEEIQAAYKRDISEADSNTEQVLVGSVYGGIIFTLTKGKVSHIFLGAAAE